MHLSLETEKKPTVPLIRHKDGNFESFMHVHTFFAAHKATCSFTLEGIKPFT